MSEKWLRNLCILGRFFFYGFSFLFFFFYVYFVHPQESFLLQDQSTLQVSERKVQRNAISMSLITDEMMFFLEEENLKKHQSFMKGFSKYSVFEPLSFIAKPVKALLKEKKIKLFSLNHIEKMVRSDIKVLLGADYFLSSFLREKLESFFEVVLIPYPQNFLDLETQEKLIWGRFEDKENGKIVYALSDLKKKELRKKKEYLIQKGFQKKRVLYYGYAGITFSKGTFPQEILESAFLENAWSLCFPRLRGWKKIDLEKSVLCQEIDLVLLSQTAQSAYEHHLKTRQMIFSGHSFKEPPVIIIPEKLLSTTSIYAYEAAQELFESVYKKELQEAGL